MNKPTAEQAIRFLYAATEATSMTPEQRREVLAAFDHAIAEDKAKAERIAELESATPGPSPSSPLH